MPLLGLGLGLACVCGCRKTPEPVPPPRPDSLAEKPAAPVKGTLALTLPCGKDSAVSLFDDTSGDDESYVRHARMDSVFSDSGYFVARTYYEGGDWLFVSKRTCAQLPLYGRALFNPSRTRFAAINEDLEAGFMANGVQIVSLVSGSPRAEVEDKQEAWGPRSGAWADDSTFVADLEDAEGHRKKRTYALRGGSWSMRDEGGAARPADTLPYPEVESDSGLPR
jgi:hypothetical protein